jgi:hypothetical protein
MASRDARLSEVENGLHDLSMLATRRTLAAARCFGEVGSLSGRQDANAECGDRQQPVGSDGRSWRSLVVEFG